MTFDPQVRNLKHLKFSICFSNFIKATYFTRVKLVSSLDHRNSPDSKLLSQNKLKIVQERPGWRFTPRNLKDVLPTPTSSHRILISSPLLKPRSLVRNLNSIPLNPKERVRRTRLRTKRTVMPKTQFVLLPGDEVQRLKRENRSREGVSTVRGTENSDADAGVGVRFVPEEGGVSVPFEGSSPIWSGALEAKFTGAEGRFEPAVDDEVGSAVRGRDWVKLSRLSSGFICILETLTAQEFGYLWRLPVLLLNW